MLAGAGSVAALLAGCATRDVKHADAAARPLKMSPARKGGDGNVLKISSFEIKVGASNPFKILHVSDTHLNFWDVADFFGNAEREDFFGKRWVRFPQALNSLLATLDYAREKGLPLFHTGDLMDWNTRGNVNVCAQVLKGVDMHYAIGNHEYHSSDVKSPALSSEGARARVAGFVANDLTAASRVINGVNFVAFDNGEKNLREETVRRVKDEFGKGMPVVLMCHIPPTYTPKFLENSNAMRAWILRGQGESEEVIAKLPFPQPIEPSYNTRTRGFWDWAREQEALKAVLCGHTHVEERDRFSDTADMYVAGGNYEGFACEITFT